MLRPKLCLGMRALHFFVNKCYKSYIVPFNAAICMDSMRRSELVLINYFETEILGFRTLSIVRIFLTTKVRKPNISVCYTPSSEPYSN
jgi:hypothetical protein